jgi:NADPH:quinone reductase-like Zn-dependent oxidoreductase
MLARSVSVLREGGKLVSVAEEPPATVRRTADATYFVAEPNRDQLIQLARLADEGTLRPVIDSAFPLSDARAAFERVVAPGKRGKVVILCSGGQSAFGTGAALSRRTEDHRLVL